MAERRKKTDKGVPRRGTPLSPVRRSVKVAKGSGRAVHVMEEFEKNKKLRGAVTFLGGVRRQEVSSVTTGSIGLDKALGIGGFARGRIVELYGPESSGKTTMALHVVASVQKAGGAAVYIDVEHAMDTEYARKVGINVDDLLISQPDTGEQAFEIAGQAVESGADVVVIDSVAALVPKAEIEGDYNESAMGLQARMMSQCLRKLTPAVGKSNTCVIFINQVREKIGVMFGNPETTSGGKALKFYASQRVEIKRIGKAAAGGDLGNRCRAKVVKNKMAPPFRTAEFDILFGHGVDSIGEALQIGEESGIVTTSGAWYTYKDQRLGNGVAQSINTLKSQPELLASLKEEISNLGLPVEGSENSDEETE